MDNINISRETFINLNNFCVTCTGPKYKEHYMLDIFKLHPALLKIHEKELKKTIGTRFWKKKS